MKHWVTEKFIDYTENDLADRLNELECEGKHVKEVIWLGERGMYMIIYTEEN